jgi:hypothetical protein
MKKAICLILLVCAILTGYASAEDLSLDSGYRASLSLNGIETKGVTYTLKEITRDANQLKVSVLHQPNDENVTLIDFAVYNDSDSQSEEWRIALMYGEHLVGSSCDVKLLLPGEEKELSCEWEEGSRAGASCITTHVFDVSNLQNLDDAMLYVTLTFFESTEQANAANAVLIFPLAGLEL